VHRHLLGLTNESGCRASQIIVDLSLRRRRRSWFLLLFSAALHGTRICLHRPISPSTNQSAPGGPTGRVGMGVRRSWNFSFLAWRNVCRRSGPCRSIAFPSKGLLVRIRRRLHRMNLYSLRDDSWSLRDYRALTRIGEGIVFMRAGASPGLKLCFLDF